MIYVCASDDNLVRVFDSETYEELPSLPSGPDPELFVLEPVARGSTSPTRTTTS